MGLPTDDFWLIGDNHSPPVSRNIAIIKDSHGQVYHDDVDYFHSEDCYEYQGTMVEGDTAYHCFIYTEGV